MFKIHLWYATFGFLLFVMLEKNKLDDLIVDEGRHIDDVRLARALQHSRAEASQETLIRWYSRIYTGEGTMHND